MKILCTASNLKNVYEQEMFNHGWNNYMQHAYPEDEVNTKLTIIEFHPENKIS